MQFALLFVLWLHLIENTIFLKRSEPVFIRLSNKTFSVLSLPKFGELYYEKSVLNHSYNPWQIIATENSELPQISRIIFTPNLLVIKEHPWFENLVDKWIIRGCIRDNDCDDVEYSVQFNVIDLLPVYGGFHDPWFSFECPLGIKGFYARSKKMYKYMSSLSGLEVICSSESTGKDKSPQFGYEIASATKIVQCQNYSRAKLYWNSVENYVYGVELECPDSLFKEYQNVFLGHQPKPSYGANITEIICPFGQVLSSVYGRGKFSVTQLGFGCKVPTQDIAVPDVIKVNSPVMLFDSIIKTKKRMNFVTEEPFLVGDEFTANFSSEDSVWLIPKDEVKNSIISFIVSSYVVQLFVLFENLTQLVGVGFALGERKKCPNPIAKEIGGFISLSCIDAVDSGRNSFNIVWDCPNLSFYFSNISLVGIESLCEATLLGRRTKQVFEVQSTNIIEYVEWTEVDPKHGIHSVHLVESGQERISQKESILLWPLIVIALIGVTAATVVIVFGTTTRRRKEVNDEFELIKTE